jgi:hypothetical protein
MLHFAFFLCLLATAINSQVSEDILCEGRYFEPSCAQGTLRIVSASYGLTDASFCGGPNAQPWSVNCAIDVADTLGQACQAKSTCSVLVTGQEVCAGASKYLQVIWTCDTGIVQLKLNNRNTNILVSNVATRVSPVPLHMLTVGGDQLYIFLDPPTGVSQVRFYLDRTDQVFSTETAAPFDFRAGFPWNSSGVINGQHRIVAAISFADGGNGSVDATFNVVNAATVPGATVPGAATVRAAATVAETSVFVDGSNASSIPTSHSTPLSLVVPWSLFGLTGVVIIVLIVVLVKTDNNLPMAERV